MFDYPYGPDEGASDTDASSPSSGASGAACPPSRSKTEALREMQAGLAAAQRRLVRDVVMDERGGMEVLDGGRGRARAPHVAADRHAGGQADERAMARGPG